MSTRFDDRVAIVTGAGAGLGRMYAMLLASLGAKVVVNDLGGSLDGGGPDSSSERPADVVVREIKAAGGEAVANYDSCVEGEKVVATAIAAYGRIDIVINNAGILRDVSFHKMTDKDFSLVHLVHVKGAFSVTRAAWPHMREARYGRVVNITSVNGLYGAFGQANYSSAKSAMVGFTKTLAKEGAKRNIKVNVLAPGAGSRMTKTVLPPDVVEMWKPDYVAPCVAFLAHENNPESGAIFESGGGWFGKVKWTRSAGHFFDIDAGFGIDEVAAKFDAVCQFETDSCDPEDDGPMDSPQIQQILAKL